MRKKISDDTYNYVFDGNMNKVNWRTESGATTCGSQLVDMLEEFNKKHTNKYDWHSYDVIVHEDMHEGTCRATLSYLSEEFTDWLYEKGYKTYHGIKMVSNFSSKEIDNVLNIFKVNQSRKGIKVYG